MFGAIRTHHINVEVSNAGPVAQLVRAADSPGSNPSGPIDQPIETPAVRNIGTMTGRGLTGRLKLFSQLFETEFTVSEYRQSAESMRSFAELEVSISGYEAEPANLAGPGCRFVLSERGRSVR
jgi:hypothetical protein